MGSNKQTAVEWLFEKAKQRGPYHIDLMEALAMEKEQHGATWDAALIQSDKRGGVLVRAVCDFDEYWDNKNKNSNGA
jgi:hypothetical protein